MRFSGLTLALIILLVTNAVAQDPDPCYECDPGYIPPEEVFPVPGLDDPWIEEFEDSYFDLEPIELNVEEWNSPYDDIMNTEFLDDIFASSLEQTSLDNVFNDPDNWAELTTSNGIPIEEIGGDYSDALEALGEVWLEVYGPTVLEELEEYAGVSLSDITDPVGDAYENPIIIGVTVAAGFVEFFLDDTVTELEDILNNVFGVEADITDIPIPLIPTNLGGDDRQINIGGNIELGEGNEPDEIRIIIEIIQ